MIQWILKYFNSTQAVSLVDTKRERRLSS